jgi:hypothetical protein
MQHLNGNLMKKFEIRAIDAVQKTYVLEAETAEEAIEIVIEQDASPVHEEIILSEIEEAREIKYVN